MSSEAYERAAADLRSAYGGSPLSEPLRDRIGLTVDDGYAVQDINTKTWIAEGRQVCGYKIGLTSPAVQKQMGVDQPDFGVLFTDMDKSGGDAIDFAELHQPRSEAEIALILGKDLHSADMSIEELADAIAFATPALEIVGRRIRNWQIGISDTIADNASSGVYVLGDVRLAVRGLRSRRRHHDDDAQWRDGLDRARRRLPGQSAVVGALAGARDRRARATDAGRACAADRRTRSDGRSAPRRYVRF